MANKKNQGRNILMFSLILIVILGITVGVQQFSVAPTNAEVWIPSYGQVSCSQTRLECSPGVCNDVNPEFNTINQDGESFYCGSPTISDANYFEGCSYYFKSTGFFDLTSWKICNRDGTNCQSINPTPDSSKFGGSTRKIEIKADKKIFVNPNFATVEYHVVAPVYGLKVQGAVKPQFSDRCNLASLLSQKQVNLLKDDPQYISIINAGEINPGVFPTVFITGYVSSYKDSRIMEKDGSSWFVEDIGTRCKIAQDTNNRWVVTDDCKEDISIECIPNIGNCDKAGKLIPTTDPSAKGCVPGTLIGSSTGRNAINAELACKTRCSSEGVPENYDCVSIERCDDGKVLSINYECIEPTKINEEEKCIANGGNFMESKDDKGNPVYECDYSGTDYFLWYLGLGTLGIIIILLLVKVGMGKGGKRK